MVVVDLVAEAAAAVGDFFQMNILTAQYQSIQGSRKELLSYCSSIKAEHFILPIENFGHSSIRNLLVHVSNASLYWLVEFALKGKPKYTKPEEVIEVERIAQSFKLVDQSMDEFLTTYSLNSLPITGWVKWSKRNISISPVELFTHVITHEFHHKGQILSMSRHLGYTPVDTDIIRF